MKILIISSFPAPYRVDVFKEISKVHETTIFFETNKDQNRSPEWFIKNSQLNFEVLDNKISKENYKKALKNIKQYDAVLAYDFYLKSAMIAQLICIFNKIPYFINCDGAFINNNFIKKQIKSYFIKNARGCFASGIHAKKYFMYYGAKENNIYIHDFTSLHREDILKERVSDKEKTELKEILGLTGNKVVLSIGQFIERKGFDILLKSWMNLDEKYELVIIGGGTLETEYLNFIKKNRFKNVKIIGFKSKEEIKKYYKAADLFVLPTREDIWGLVINEAMANGLPVITTNRCIAGLELINNGENGFIIDVDDSKKLTNKIVRILEDSSLLIKISNNNLKKIKTNTVENIGKNHLYVIENCLKNYSKG